MFFMCVNELSLCLHARLSERLESLQFTVLYSGRILKDGDVFILWCVHCVFMELRYCVFAHHSVSDASTCLHVTLDNPQNTLSTVFRFLLQKVVPLKTLHGVLWIIFLLHVGLFVI